MNGSGRKLKSETAREIEISNQALERCYKRFERFAVFMPSCPEWLREEYMTNCVRAQIAHIKQKEAEKKAKRPKKAELFRNPRLTNDALTGW